MSRRISASTHNVDVANRASRFGPLLSGRRLVLIAAILHVFVSVTISILGRAQVAPAFIDRDGIMASFAFDSYDYQRGAMQLAGLLKSGSLFGWASAAEPVHVRIIAVPFAVFGSLFGYGPLSAEPYNLVCYAAIVALVFALGREVAGRRVGMLAAAVVAVCPTFLLHTTQLLKDPLFIAIALTFVFCVTTWLTRIYTPRLAAAVTAITIVMMLLLFVVRARFVIVIIAVASLGLGLLVVRQWLQRRLLIWNMVSPVAVLFVAFMLTPLYLDRATAVAKQYQASNSGQPKVEVVSHLRIPTRVVRVSPPLQTEGVAGELRARTDRLATRVSSMRSTFAGSYPEAGSVTDGTREFRSLNDLLRYLPRAMEIGLWAPFPNTWVLPGRRVGNAGRLLAGAETFLIYVCQILAIVAVLRHPRRLVLFFLFALATLGVTAFAVVVPNIGALYRFRYTFWILLIIVGVAGLDHILTSVAARVRTRPQADAFVSGRSEVEVLAGGGTTK